MKATAANSSLAAEDVVARARWILEAAYYSFLVTVDDTGAPCGRMVQHFNPDNQLTLCLGTRASSRKVTQLRLDPRAMITCQSPTDRAYVAMSGTVVIHDAPEVKRHHWREPWRNLWPEGSDSPDYVVLEFRCERLEIVDLSSVPIAPPPFGMTPAVVVSTPSGWHLQDHLETAVAEPGASKEIS